MSDKSDSESSRGADAQNDDSRSRRRRSESDDRRKETHKLFITGLDGNARESALERELEPLFEKYGKLDRITIKRSRHNEYSYGFVEYERGVDGSAAVRNLDQMEIGGKKMKVELQDDSRRRKNKNEGCYICGKFGHFARECREKRERSRSRRRRRSDSREYRRRRSSTPRSRSRRKDKDRRSKKERRERRDRSRSSRRSDSRRRNRRSRSDSYD